jgi:hypothetical protein
MTSGGDRALRAIGGNDGPRMLGGGILRMNVGSSA